MTIDEFVVSLGFEFNDKDIKKFSDGMETVKSVAKGVAIVATAVSTAITGVAVSAAAAGDKLDKASVKLGVTVQDLQELDFVATQAGASSDDMTNSLLSLNKVASEASRGVGAGVEAFGLLGISVTDAQGKIKKTPDLLNEIADELNKLPDSATKAELATKLLGGSAENLLPALTNGSAGIKAIREEANALGFAMGEDAVKNSVAFTDEMDKVTRIIGGLKNAIGSDLLPQMTSMLKGFKEWFIANKLIIKQKIQKAIEIFSKAVSFLIDMFSKLFSIVGDVINVFGGLDRVLRLVAATVATLVAFKLGSMLIGLIGIVRSLGTAMLAMNAKALIIPIIIATIAAAMILLFEDIFVFFTGGKSVIGELLDEFPKVKEFILSAIEVIKSVDWSKWTTKTIDILIMGFNLLKEAVFAVFEVLKVSADGWLMVFEGIGIVIDNVIDSLTSFIDKLSGVKEIVSDALGGVKDFGSIALESGKSVFENIFGSSEDNGATENINNTENSTSFISENNNINQGGNLSPVMVESTPNINLTPLVDAIGNINMNTPTVSPSSIVSNTNNNNTNTSEVTNNAKNGDINADISINIQGSADQTTSALIGDELKQSLISLKQNTLGGTKL